MQTIRTLPALNSTDWYGHYTDLDLAARELQTGYPLSTLVPPINGSVVPTASGTGGYSPAVGTLALGPMYVPPATYGTVACRVSSVIASTDKIKMIGFWGSASGPVGALAFETAQLSIGFGGFLGSAITPIVVPFAGAILWLGVVNQTAADGFWATSAGNGLYAIRSTSTPDTNITGGTAAQITGVTGAAPSNGSAATLVEGGQAPRMALIRSA